MVRFLIRIFVSPLAIAIINLLILVPLVLAIVDVIRSLWHGGPINDPLDIVEGMGVILIGWGVAMEERSVIRELFALTGLPDEWRQTVVDHDCHAAGVGLLIFGLFAEMCIEAIRLPNHIINTEGINEIVLAASLVFLALCVWILARNILSLAMALLAQPSPSQQAGHH